MIRHSLLGAALALATFSVTGCTPSSESNETQPAPETARPVETPAHAADALSKKLADLSARIRKTDQALGRLVAVSATDASDRALAFDKAAAAVGADTVTTLASDLKAQGVRINEAWDAAIAKITDTAERRRAMSSRDLAAANFAALDKALKGSDAAFLQVTHRIRQARNATGLHPSPTEIVRARPLANQVSESVKTLDGWIRYTDSVLKEIARTPVPEPVVAPAAPEEPLPCETAPEAPKPAPSETSTAAESEAPEVSPVLGDAADPVPDPVEA